MTDVKLTLLVHFHIFFLFSFSVPYVVNDIFKITTLMTFHNDLIFWRISCFLWGNISSVRNLLFSYSWTSLHSVGQFDFQTLDDVLLNSLNSSLSCSISKTPTVRAVHRTLTKLMFALNAVLCYFRDGWRGTVDTTGWLKMTDRQSCRTWNSRTWQWRTKWNDWKLQNMKLQDKKIYM